MDNDEWTDFIGKQMQDAPKMCNFCDYFSGNNEGGIAVRPAWFMHPEIYGTKIDEDDPGCGRFNLTAGAEPEPRPIDGPLKR
jgi:hypothetical protein